MANRSYSSTIDFGFGFGITPVVKKLLVANIAAFVVAILAPRLGIGGAIGWLELRPYLAIHRLALWQLVTYLFLHDGFFHIFFNMWALWMFGSELERTWGARRFTFYYFLTGIGAGLTVLLLNPSSMAPTVGASGAIYGLLLAYGLLFPNRMILFFFLFPIPAKYLVMILGAIELLSELSLQGDGISHLAHLGGLAVGFLYLRGRPPYFELRNRYYRWRRQRLQRQFKVYMSKHDHDEDRPAGPNDRWVN